MQDEVRNNVLREQQGGPEEDVGAGPAQGQGRAGDEGLGHRAARKLDLAAGPAPVGAGQRAAEAVKIEDPAGVGDGAGRQVEPGRRDGVVVAGGGFGDGTLVEDEFIAGIAVETPVAVKVDGAGGEVDDGALGVGLAVVVNVDPVAVVQVDGAGVGDGAVNVEVGVEVEPAAGLDGQGTVGTEIGRAIHGAQFAAGGDGDVPIQVGAVRRQHPAGRHRQVAEEFAVRADREVAGDRKGVGQGHRDEAEIGDGSSLEAGSEFEHAALQDEARNNVLREQQGGPEEDVGAGPVQDQGRARDEGLGHRAARKLDLAPRPAAVGAGQRVAKSIDIEDPAGVGDGAGRQVEPGRGDDVVVAGGGLGDGTLVPDEFIAVIAMEATTAVEVDGAGGEVDDRALGVGLAVVVNVDPVAVVQVDGAGVGDGAVNVEVSIQVEPAAGQDAKGTARPEIRRLIHCAQFATRGDSDVTVQVAVVRREHPARRHGQVAIQHGVLLQQQAAAGGNRDGSRHRAVFARAERAAIGDHQQAGSERCARESQRLRAPVHPGAEGEAVDIARHGGVEVDRVGAGHGDDHIVTGIRNLVGTPVRGVAPVAAQRIGPEIGAGIDDAGDDVAAGNGHKRAYAGGVRAVGDGVMAIRDAAVIHSRCGMGLPVVIRRAHVPADRDQIHRASHGQDVVSMRIASRTSTARGEDLTTEIYRFRPALGVRRGYQRTGGAVNDGETGHELAEPEGQTADRAQPHLPVCFPVARIR